MSRAPGTPVAIADNGVRLTVRVTPRAKRSAAAGVIDLGEGRCALAVRLAAPPVEGAANRALIAFLAAELGIASSAVRIVSGDHSRVKLVAIAGIAPDRIAPLLQR